MKKISVLLSALIICASNLMSQTLPSFSSPEGKLSVQMVQNSTQTYMKIKTARGLAISTVYLGLTTSVENFKTKLAFVSASEPTLVTDEYDNIHGKRSHVKNQANEVTAHFTNETGTTNFDIQIRAYDNGIAFRYIIPNGGNVKRTFNDEATTFQIPSSAHRWLQSFVTSYEGDFPYQASEGTRGSWGFPALFEYSKVFMLITEANVSRMYSATHLDNNSSAGMYKVSYPFSWEGGESLSTNPSWTGNWTSPWRVMIIGELKDIVESTLVEDVSDPCKISNTSWIKPGSASWIYWAYNHGTRDYQICKQYIDLAATMGWPYVLFDWEWESMGNGGNLQDACNYAKSKGVKPMIWYHSNDDKMKNRSRRINEFKWLNNIGVYGIKVDFFECDKQDFMKYYLDILEDAAQYKILVNFHGATVPKGWSRTYPNLMSTEAVYGAEWYNNNNNMTSNGPRINCLHPFIRNVVGPMDYTPVAFTNSQNPHTTTYAHELALSVAFESGIQHWADRPEGFYALPEMARRHMEKIPTAWDDIRFISGYPGQSFVVARRKGDRWYVGGLQGENKKASFKVPLNFLSEGEYTASIIADGANDKDFKFSTQTVTNAETLSVICLAKGGFVMMFDKAGDATRSDLSKLQTKVESLLSEAAGHVGFNTGNYDQTMIEAMSEALTQSRTITTASSSEEVFKAYQTLLAAYSNFQEHGRVEGGAITDKQLTQNITAKYLIEARNFSRSDNGNTRFGVPANWTVENYNIPNGNDGTKNGTDKYLGWDCLSLGVWNDNSSATVDISKARLYRRVTLPAGRYFFGCSYPTLYTLTDSYIFVATQPLTAAQTKSRAIAYMDVSSAQTDGKWYGVTFELAEEKSVCLGWNADLTTNSQQEFRVGEVALLRYLNAEGEWIAEEALDDDPLYLGANQCAEQLSTTNTYSSRNDRLLAASSGNTIVVGDLNLDFVSSVSAFVNTSNSLTNASIHVLLDNSSTAWCKIPIDNKQTSSAIEYKADVTRTVTGVHKVKLRFTNAPVNLWGVQFERTIPDGIDMIDDDAGLNGGNIVIYNISGQRLSEVPQNGLYIVKQGNKVTKVFKQ